MFYLKFVNNDPVAVVNNDPIENTDPVAIENYKKNV